MNASFSASALACLLSAIGSHASPELAFRIERGAHELSLIFETQPSARYQLLVSTNLLTWSESGTAVVGDGLGKTQAVTQADLPLAFFRLRATGPSDVGAPDADSFAALVVGQLIVGYQILNDTQFSWFGETGRWSYAQIDDTTARLVFTYDEDGNNSAIYREEVLMTFTSPTDGTYRYAELTAGVEDSSSVRNGSFDLATP